MVIIENAIGPQEYAPVDAPIIVPKILVPIFLVFLISLTRKTFIDTAIAERNDNSTINEKLKVESEYKWKTKNGSKKRNSEMMINGKKSNKKIPIAIRI